MKIIPEILLSDPNDIPQYVDTTTKNILSLIEERVKTSDTAKKIETDLYVYIVFDRNNILSFKQLTDKLYFRIDESFFILSELRNLASVLQRGVQINAVIPDAVNSCGVFISLVPHKKTDYLSLETSEVENNEISNSRYIAVEPDHDLEDVVMNDDERKAIMRAITLISEKDLIFDKWNSKKIDKHTKSILCFHGQPGTGKTMAAHGVAKKIGKKILIASYAQIESEFVGVGAKNLKTFFEQAEKQDSVLFIDEADTFLSKRLPSSNDSAKHYNSMSNELYQLVENFNGCIIFASNHIKDFDPAIISRIIEPIEFKLPDYDARKQILSRLIQKEFPIEGGKTDALISELADISDGFSGRDIRKALIISTADAAYLLKIVEGKKDEDIIVPIDLLKQVFTEVKKAKLAIENATGKSNGNLLLEYTAKKQRDTRYIQMAAHALLADGIVEPKEKALFEELSRVMKVSAPLKIEDLPSIETICAETKSKEERIQVFDVVTRMAASDHMVPKEELMFINKVACLLGIHPKDSSVIEKYTLDLANSYKMMEDISTLFGMTDDDILSELQREYSESSALFHLGELYTKGSDLFGGIIPDENKAKKYMDLASEKGYVKTIYSCLHLDQE